LQGGFRSDWTLSSRDTLTVEGDLFGSRGGQSITTVLSKNMFQTRTFDDPLQVDSLNILARWNHTYNSGSQNIAFNRASITILIVGVGYRHTRLSYDGFYNYRYNQPRFTSHLLSTFIQDEIRLTRTVALIMGSKFERNSFTGFELEPSAQLVLESEFPKLGVGLGCPCDPPAIVVLPERSLGCRHIPRRGHWIRRGSSKGNGNSRAEQLFDYQIGYRNQFPGEAFFAFEPAPPHLLLPVVTANLLVAGTTARNWWLTGKSTGGVSALDLPSCK
jgi:hypothetical protein